MERHDFGGKPSKWRWGRVILWKIPEFCSVGGARSKISIFFAFWWYPSILRTAYSKQFYLQTNGTDGKPRLWRSGESVTRHLADIGPWRVPKSGHVTITKIENIDIRHMLKNSLIPKCYSFRSTTKNSEVIAENRFRTVASPHAALVNAWPSWIGARRQYILLGIIYTGVVVIAGKAAFILAYKLQSRKVPLFWLQIDDRCREWLNDILHCRQQGL